jgi:hypothetical protein
MNSINAILIIYQHNEHTISMHSALQKREIKSFWDSEITNLNHPERSTHPMIHIRWK